MSSSPGRHGPVTLHSSDQDLSQYSQSSWFQSVIVGLLSVLLLYLLYPNKVMDLVDAYMELPYLSFCFYALTLNRSFADIPLILKDQLRGYGSRARRMPLLVLRPFASEDILTQRDRDILSNRLQEDSVTERYKGHPPVSETSSIRVPGLVNSGNFCFMNSVLQVPSSLCKLI